MMTKSDKDKKDLQLPKYWVLPKWLTNKEVRLLKQVHAAEPSLSMDEALRRMMLSSTPQTGTDVDGTS